MPAIPPLGDARPIAALFITETSVAALIFAQCGIFFGNLMEILDIT
jgi:hypothetical protein